MCCTPGETRKTTLLFPRALTASQDVALCTVRLYCCQSFFLNHGVHHTCRVLCAAPCNARLCELVTSRCAAATLCTSLRTFRVV